MSNVKKIISQANKTYDYDSKKDTIIKSFTEPDLFIYSKPGYHSNIFNGGFVHGGSSFKKHFTPPFDQEARANGLAKHWGVSGGEILRLWKAKGKSTSELGTAFHKILELENNGEEWSYDLVLDAVKLTRRMYMANLEIGEKIFEASKSATENYAKPTHLDIRAMMKMSDDEIKTYTDNVIKEFKEMDSITGYDKYKKLAEVYVTYEDYQMGGEIDRLLIIDKENKICRVQDYKFKDKVMDEESSNNKLLNELEKKKASENDIIKIQLSFYAYCLEKAGWTVEGGDVFSRNGEWKNYAIDLIPHEEMTKLLDKYLK